MSNWNTVWSFSTARFTVSLDWSWEDYPDLSWDETGETQAKCESGEWGVFTFRTRCTLDGREIAADYLGNSIYADPKEFYKEHLGVRAMARKDGKNYGCYFTDMVATVVDEARKSLRDLPEMRR